MSHTPGPWDNNKWNCEEHQISANGGTIALVSHYHTLVSEEEADANARLIAASPLLIEACRQASALLADISHYVPDYEFEKSSPNVNDMRDILDAAIARAKGICRGSDRALSSPRP